MTRTNPTFPLTIQNGSLALSSDADRDEQDIVATVFTRLTERIMRPYSAGTPSYLFTAVRSGNAIAKKLAVAVEDQVPVARCAGVGSVDEDGKVTVKLYWTPTADSDEQTLALRIS